MKPSITVGIPTYNGARYISECIESILNQTFSNFEIIVVDDQSSDETLDIVKKYQHQDYRIKLFINPKNLGLVGNWNRCIELAQGEWIKFVFQDDFIESDCLEKMYSLKREGSELICCRREFIFEEGVSQKDHKMYRQFVDRFSLDSIFPGITEISALNYCESLLNHIGVNFVGEPVSTLIHRGAFYKYGFFNPYMTQICDFEFLTRIAVHTGILYIPENLSIFRVHNRSTSAFNRESREYRTLLDNMILLHDFVFAPVYAPLRPIASRVKSVRMENQWTSNSLINLLRDKSYILRRVAEKAAFNSTNPNPKLLEEWKSIVQYYPLLAIASQRSIFKRIVDHTQYRWKQLTAISKR